jgi:hypothetical protein
MCAIFCLKNSFICHFILPYIREPIRHLDCCSGIKYSLQLNIYKYILETFYDIRVSKMFVVSFHPSMSSYCEFEIEDYSHEVACMIKSI